MERDEYLRANFRELRSGGVSLRDALVAVHLAWFIKGLDATFFSRQYPVHFDLRYAHDRRVAEYVQNTQYIIYTPDLGRQFWILRQQISPTPTLFHRIVGVAVHEVRHRLQAEALPPIRRWHTDHHAAGVLGMILEHSRNVWLWKILVSFDEGNPAGVEHFQREFDASVVELYALSRMNSIRTPQELADIVCMEP